MHPCLKPCVPCQPTPNCSAAAATLHHQVYRGKRGVLRVDVTWFNRRSDIPAKEARRVKLPTDAPRQVGAGGCWGGCLGRLLSWRRAGCMERLLMGSASQIACMCLHESACMCFA